MEDRFRTPGSVSDQVLLGVARGFATDALPLKTELINRGLPANFLDDLNSDIAAFEQATLRQAQGTETRVAATAGIEDQFDDALSLLRELGPIMVNMFADDPTVLAAWTSASHIERPARKAAPAKPPTPAGPSA
jgi:hypothetical protein